MAQPTLGVTCKANWRSFMNCDVLIIGAGPAGLCLARELSTIGLHAIVLEKQPREAVAKPDVDGRDIALTHASQGTLRELMIWQRMPEDEVGHIREARVVDGESDYALTFDHASTSCDALGFMVSNHVIRQAAHDAIDGDSRVDLRTGVEVTGVVTNENSACVVLDSGDVLEAPLAVAADSRFSATRRQMGIGADMRDFGKTVIVCRMTPATPHKDTAWECFHYGRTLAVLPLPDGKVSIVVTAPTDVAEALMRITPAEFAADISARFGYRLGDMTLSGDRHAYPLVAVYADRFVSRRFALVGDAAVGMHPVTAHGFNLGLRGAHTLAIGIRRAHALRRDIGSDFLLARYNRRHRSATWPIYHGTNRIVNLFNDDRPLTRLMRSAVLRIGNNVPPLKRAILDQLTEIRPGILPMPRLPFGRP
jgi:ubiquinone biosynthesis UbiH/UbiF/VisC/COQ6 family hydroxylase